MITIIVALILAIATGVFALQNTEVVTVRFLLWEYQTSLVLVIFGSTGAGMVLIFLALLTPWFRRSRTIRSLESTTESQGVRIRELEEALRLSRKDPPPPASK